MFYEKIRKNKKRNLSFESEETLPPAKKQKRSVKKMEVFIIEKILDFKFNSGKEYFYVKWKDWPDSENTWEPVEHLDNCPDVIKHFLITEEIKHCRKFEKLKEELAFGDLLNEENLLKRFSELEDVDILKLKHNLMLKLLSIIFLPKDQENYGTELVQDTRDLLQLYTVTRKRCQQLMKLKEWEEHLNEVDKYKKLIIENDVDLAGPPENFTYINQSIPGNSVIIPDDPPIGCECVACNCRSKYCCGMQAGLFAYTKNKRLRVAPGTPIYECNKACKCSSECNNRVVQSGRNVKLTIFRTSNDCGWGVRTEQKIKQGQFICQYVGEVITFEEAEKRGRSYDANGFTYLFDLDFNSVENPYVVDAAYYGNVSHFINHSCDPNLGVWAVWADCLDPNLPILALFATRDIECGEEICFDYLHKSIDSDNNETNGNTNNSQNTSDNEVINSTDISTPFMGSPMKSRFEMQQQNMAMLRNRTECKCGTMKCRKYLF